MVTKAEKIEVLALMLHASVEEIVPEGGNWFAYKGKYYWVVADNDDGTPHEKTDCEDYVWFGCSGPVHVYAPIEGKDDEDEFCEELCDPDAADPKFVAEFKKLL